MTLSSMAILFEAVILGASIVSYDFNSAALQNLYPRGSAAVVGNTHTANTNTIIVYLIVYLVVSGQRLELRPRLCRARIVASWALRRDGDSACAETALLG